MLAETLRWQERGLCKPDPEPWSTPTRAGWARHQCLHHCPVLVECREWAERYMWDSIVVAGIAYGGRKSEGQGAPLTRQPELMCVACVAGGCSECGKRLVGRPAQARTCSPQCYERRAWRLRKGAPEVRGGREMELAVVSR